MRFMFALCCAVLLPASLCGAAELTLYKEFFLGQAKAGIEKMPGMTDCSDEGLDLLCREGQSFAGLEWVQVLVFEEEALVRVALSGPSSDNGRFVNAVGAIAGSDFTVILVQAADGRAFDVLETLRAKKADVVQNELGAFLLMAASIGEVALVCVPNEAVMAAKKENRGKAFFDFFMNAPLETRFVEIKANETDPDDDVVISFTFPVAAMKKMHQQMGKQKEKF